MIYTFTKLISINKRKKKPRSNHPLLGNRPQRKAVCIKIKTLKPRKPNSSLKLCTQLACYDKTGKKIFMAYVPGQGKATGVKAIAEFNNVLVCGDKRKDCSIFKTRVIRGALDSEGEHKFRRQSRSKYGAKRVNTG